MNPHTRLSRWLFRPQTLTACLCPEHDEFVLAFIHPLSHCLHVGGGSRWDHASVQCPCTCIAKPDCAQPERLGKLCLVRTDFAPGWMHACNMTLHKSACVKQVTAVVAGAQLQRQGRTGHCKVMDELEAHGNSTNGG